MRGKETSQRIELKLGKSFNAFDVMRSEMNKTFALEHFTDVGVFEYGNMVYGGCVCLVYRLHSGHHIRKIGSAYAYNTF